MSFARSVSACTSPSTCCFLTCYDSSPNLDNSFSLRLRLPRNTLVLSLVEIDTHTTDFLSQDYCFNSRTQTSSPQRAFQSLAAPHHDGQVCTICHATPTRLHSRLYRTGPGRSPRDRITRRDNWRALAKERSGGCRYYSRRR